MNRFTDRYVGVYDGICVCVCVIFNKGMKALWWRKEGLSQQTRWSTWTAIRKNKQNNFDLIMYKNELKMDHKYKFKTSKFLEAKVFFKIPNTKSAIYRRVN